jgi:hypothetical protein
MSIQEMVCRQRICHPAKCSNASEVVNAFRTFPGYFQAMVQIGRSGAGASVLGLFLGLALCTGALRVMRSVLYGVGVYDAPTLATAVVTLAPVTVLATTLPTLRIAKIDPANTLREE